MPHSILVVEDEPHIVDLLSFLMKQAGYVVRIARDGDSAIRMIEDRRPDLVLLDIMLPRQNGYDVCLRIRQTPAWADIKVIMLSAKGRDFDRSKGLQLGADDYVTKPFSNREIVDRVNQLLARSD